MTTGTSEADWAARARRSASTRESERGAAVEVELLPPHASLRRYARVRFADGGTEIVMLMPPADAIADEVGSVARSSLASDPFVVVAQWLDDAGVAAPRVRAIDEAESALWLDDLGSVDLDTWVRAAPGALEDRYVRALDLLLSFQRASRDTPPPSVVQSRAMDASLLRWELDHYIEWRLEAWLGVTPTPAERGALGAAFDGLVTALTEVPLRPVHRDFQSHNIMVTGDRLWLLDFQDALMGPAVYDAVALLRDSYVEIPEPVLLSLLDRYARRLADEDPDPSVTQQSVTRWFHMQTVQRKLKDAARFVFIDRVKGNPSFLPYIPASTSYVSAAFRALGGELEPLRNILLELDPEVAQ